MPHLENISFKKGPTCHIQESEEATSSRGKNCATSELVEELGPQPCLMSMDIQFGILWAKVLIRLENGAMRAQCPSWKTKACPP